MKNYIDWLQNEIANEVNKGIAADTVYIEKLRIEWLELSQTDNSVVSEYEAETKLIAA